MLRCRVRVLHGWRCEILGRELLELFEGKLSLSVEDGRLVVSRKASGGAPEQASGVVSE